VSVCIFYSEGFHSIEIISYLKKLVKKLASQSIFIIFDKRNKNMKLSKIKKRIIFKEREEEDNL
jgi:hypothetical protein